MAARVRMCTQRLSCLILCDPMDCVHQVPLSMGFSRQVYWSGLPCPPPGNLPDSGMELVSPASPALQVGSLSHRASSREIQIYVNKLASPLLPWSSFLRTEWLSPGL